MPDAEARKARSIAYLQEHQVPYIDHLPVIETAAQTNLRSREEIARRAVCCLLAIQHAFDHINEHDVAGSRQFFEEMLERWGLWADLTPEERLLFTGQPVDQAKLLALTWKYEAYWPLVWALGLVEELAYPETICDCDTAIQLVSRHQDFASFLAATTRRSDSEILDQADLIYRLHWACVEARIKGQPTPAKLNPDVVMERHAGLNWLIGYDEDWDNMPTDT